MAWGGQGSQPYGNGGYFNDSAPNYNHYSQYSSYNGNSYGQNHQPYSDSYNDAPHASHWVGYNNTPPRPSIDTQNSYSTQASSSVSSGTQSPWGTQSPQSPYGGQSPQNNYASNHHLAPPTQSLSHKRSKRELAAQGINIVGKGMIAAGSLAAPFSVIDPFVTPIVSASVIAGGTSLCLVAKICKRCNNKFKAAAENTRAFCDRCF